MADSQSSDTKSPDSLFNNRGVILKLSLGAHISNEAIASMIDARMMTEGADKLFLASAVFMAYDTVAAIRLSDLYLVLSPILQRGRDRLISAGHAEVVKNVSI